jgi:hypothetical protein
MGHVCVDTVSAATFFSYKADTRGKINTGLEHYVCISLNKVIKYACLIGSHNLHVDIYLVSLTVTVILVHMKNQP